MKLNLNLLPVIVALAEEGSVSAAARKLRMSQPSLSSALAKLRSTTTTAVQRIWMSGNNDSRTSSGGIRSRFQRKPVARAARLGSD